MLNNIRKVIKLIFQRENESVFNVNGFLQIHWKDKRLAWNESHYEGLNILHIPSELIWKPQISLANRWDIDNINKCLDEVLDSTSNILEAYTLLTTMVFFPCSIWSLAYTKFFSFQILIIYPLSTYFECLNNMFWP